MQDNSSVSSFMNRAVFARNAHRLRTCSREVRSREPNTEDLTDFATETKSSVVDRTISGKVPAMTNLRSSTSSAIDLSLI